MRCTSIDDRGGDLPWSGALWVVRVLGTRVDDHHAKRDDNHRQYRGRRDDKKPPYGTDDGEDVGHRPAKAPSAQEVYARIQRDERDQQVDDAPQNEVRVHQVAHLGHPPAGPRERQERAQSLKASDHEHDDGGEGEHARPSRRPTRTLHGIANPSRHRFTVLRHFLSPLCLRTARFPCIATYSRCSRALITQWSVSPRGFLADQTHTKADCRPCVALEPP